MNSYLLDLGKTRYTDAHQLQLECVTYRLDAEEQADIFIVTEHHPVFTLGRRGGRESLRVPEQHLEEQGVDIVQTERGGDITYHGPGQLVVYPIVHLRKARLSVKRYVDLLEDTMILCAAEFGVNAARDQRNRGIWVGDNKLGSIGIRVRHGITFHGLALNVSLDCTHFGWIQPCGLRGVGVTSLFREAGKQISFDDVKKVMIKHLATAFETSFVRASVTMFSGLTV